MLHDDETLQKTRLAKTPPSFQFTYLNGQRYRDRISKKKDVSPGWWAGPVLGGVAERGGDGEASVAREILLVLILETAQSPHGRRTGHHSCNMFDDVWKLSISY